MEWRPADEHKEKEEKERNYEDSARAVRDAGKMPPLCGIKIINKSRSYDNNFDRIFGSKR
jgi:hypothetical protein